VAFSDRLAWFFTVTREGGRTLHRLTVVRPDGSVAATAESDEGASEWWAGYRGAGAAGDYLFIPTDEGVVRLNTAAGVDRPDKEFPDTEAFVSSASRLLVGRDGLYAVQRRSITRLEMR
jgi:hypothetical protein